MAISRDAAMLAVAGKSASRVETNPESLQSLSGHLLGRFEVSEDFTKYQIYSSRKNANLITSAL